jgi:hypothetical protein
MSKARILIAMAATGLAFAVAAPAAGAAGFGVECEGGGVTCQFAFNMVGEEKSVVIINQAVIAQKLTSLSETFRNNGKEFIELNAGDRTACLNKNYGAGETCKVRAKYYKEINPLEDPIAELIVTVQPAGCPNMAKFTV